MNSHEISVIRTLVAMKFVDDDNDDDVMNSSWENHFFRWRQLQARVQYETPLLSVISQCRLNRGFDFDFGFGCGFIWFRLCH